MLRPAHGLRGALAWLKRVVAARRELEALARMSEHDLKDIGLTRSDVGDVTALPADVSPTHFLAQRGRGKAPLQPVGSRLSSDDARAAVDRA